MDARWKVYIQDRRFDDNEISKTYIKFKYGSVGRFKFDLRLLDTEEATYFATGNTLRIFWGDIHKLDGVIQRSDWDDDNYCYHIYGADLRGLLLDRIPQQQATVNSYTSDIVTSVMFDGCDFPTNIWTGLGQSIGRYTFNYNINILNTIRITQNLPMYIWEAGTIIERGTVYEHVNGCLYDATKSWATNEFAGMVLRFVSGDCKNNVYNINGNTTNRVCIRLPGESGVETGTVCDRYVTVGATTYYNTLDNSGFEDGTDPWTLNRELTSGTAEIITGGYDSDYCLHLDTGAKFEGLWHVSSATQITTIPIGGGERVEIRYKMYRSGRVGNKERGIFRVGVYDTGGGGPIVINTPAFGSGTLADYNPSYPDWDVATAFFSGSPTAASGWYFYILTSGYSDGRMEAWVDNVSLSVSTATNPCALWGSIPGCSRVGDIYEIVTTQKTLTYRVPPDLVNATLEKNNHIIRFNTVDDLSKYITSMTVRGS